MARKKRNAKVSEIETADYRHTGEKRKNIPPAKIAAEGEIPEVKKARYYYSPHLPPTLQFDTTGKADQVVTLVEQAARALPAEKQQRVSEAIRVYEPWLEWASKREQHERGFFDVDPVALHIHERVSARAIIRAAMREDVQRDIFADPQQPYQEAVQFYQHDVDWANRLILGDSLQVMSSLARREGLAGKVQMVYIDPPYGIRFASNFQPLIRKREVTDRDSDLTREPETVSAYRDTWALGVHSYLAYLRDRLVAARELLCGSGSVFVQIGIENVHRVRAVMDEVFGPQNFVCLIVVEKTQGQTSTHLASVCDYLLWYARSIKEMTYYQLYPTKSVGSTGASGYTLAEDSESGYVRSLTKEELESPEVIDSRWKVLDGTPLVSQSGGENSQFTVQFEGRAYLPKGTFWKTNPEGFRRLIAAHRLIALGERIEYRRYLSDFPVYPLANLWTGLGERGFVGRKLYVVQTAAEVVRRCILMTTRPGQLVLDPTCGSGTTAFAAEELGRRWITVDTSRVSLAIARQRMLTARFQQYRIKDGSANPAAGFVYETVPHITLKSIAQNNHLDPIFAKHEPLLNAALEQCNVALGGISAQVLSQLEAKLTTKQRAGGKRAISNRDRRRWLLPDRFEHWTVPFDTDSDWPKEFLAAVVAYRKAWRAKMDEVHACIVANAEQEELVAEPAPLKGIVRVSGPFTVEGVRPEELSLGGEGLFDATPNEFDQGGSVVEVQNFNAYLTRMLQALRTDGLTFTENKHKKFSRLEPLFEHATGGLIHAEGAWGNGDGDGPNTVAVSFGPQYGPVTALQVEDAIRECKRYDELVVAGFSFDAEAAAVIEEQKHPRLRIHMAYIRPDLNPAMEGLLKDTPSSQLFTVFGQPELTVEEDDDGEWTVTLRGVDIYDPVANTVRSTGAEKVAAWFLDSDYDGRCFCITQAFFPDQDAWEKIAKALGGSTDPEAFEAFKGTTSLPFKAGKFNRIAIKVIDPRGNEVMAIRKLED